MASLPLYVLIGVYNVFVAFTALAFIQILDSFWFALVALVLSSAAMALMLHHNWDHGHADRPGYIEDPDERCFQRSDVCNFKTCNHEMWILFFMAIAGVSLFLAFEAAMFGFLRTLN